MMPSEAAVLNRSVVGAFRLISTDVPLGKLYRHVCDLSVHIVLMSRGLHSPHTASVGTMGHVQFTPEHSRSRFLTSTDRIPLYTAALVDTLRAGTATC